MKKVLALVLALVMTIGIVGIVNADDGKIKVEISVMNDNGNEFPWQYGEDLVPQIVTARLEFIRDLLPGYEITIHPMCYENLSDQMPMLVASGDVPDICIFNKFDWMKYLDAGVFIEDLNELVDTYGTNLRTILNPASFKYCTVGGQLKAIPCENFNYKYPTWLRMDWVRKLGFEVKDTYTLSEIKEILLAFTTQDPDGNGKDDTYGLGTRFSKDNTSWDVTFMSIFGAFGGQPGQAYLNDGKFEVFNYMPEFRDALMWLKEMYAAKAIDQEAFILSYDQALQNAINGRGGMYTGWWNSGYDLVQNGFSELQPDEDLESIFITSDDGTKAGMLDNGVIYKAHMISNKAEHPEAVMKLLDFLFSSWDTMYTLEPTTYDGKSLPHIARDENGLFAWNLPEVQNGGQRYDTWFEGATSWTMEQENARGIELYEKYGKNNIDYTPAMSYADGIRASCFNNITNCIAQKAREVDAVIVRMDMSVASAEANGLKIPAKTLESNRVEKIGRLIQSNPDNRPVYQDAFYGLPNTEEFNELKPNIDTFQKEWVVKFVTGELEINDENWQKYLDTAVQTGAQTVLASQVKAYNDLNGTSYTAMSINGK